MATTDHARHHGAHRPCVSTFLASALAMTCAQAWRASPDEARLLATLQHAHPGTQFSQVARTPVEGLYEVWMNTNVAYVLMDSLRGSEFADSEVKLAENS